MTLFEVKYNWVSLYLISQIGLLLGTAHWGNLFKILGQFNTKHSICDKLAFDHSSISLGFCQFIHIYSSQQWTEIYLILISRFQISDECMSRAILIFTFCLLIPLWNHSLNEVIRKYYFSFKGQRCFPYSTEHIILQFDITILDGKNELVLTLCSIKFWVIEWWWIRWSARI